MSLRGVIRGLMGAALLIACLASGARTTGRAHAAVARSVAPTVSATIPAAVNARPIPSAGRMSAASPAGEDDRQDIRDIHGPLALPRRLPLVQLIAGALALTAVAAGIVVYRRRRRPPLPPHERALRALEELHEPGGADPRVFSFAASEIVRTYVEAAFSVRAAHRTTEELLADLMQDRSPVALHRAELATFLHYCDLAKFAAWSLSAAEMAAMLASAKAFVRATAPSGAAQPALVAAAPGGEGMTLA